MFKIFQKFNKVQLVKTKSLVYSIFILNIYIHTYNFLCVDKIYSFIKQYTYSMTGAVHHDGNIVQVLTEPTLQQRKQTLN